MDEDNRAAQPATHHQRDEAGMLEAERQFRRVIGYRDLANLAVAIERELKTETPQPTDREEVAIVLTA